MLILHHQQQEYDLEKSTILHLDEKESIKMVAHSKNVDPLLWKFYPINIIGSIYLFNGIPLQHIILKHF